MTQRKVLIVGGGIGGLATAVALRQAGFTVSVLEREHDLHSSVFGVGIIQPSNALRALDVIGCAQACIDEGYAAEAWGAMYDIEGGFIRDIHGARIEGTDLPPMNGVTRPKLHRILTDRALEVGAEIRYSAAFESLEQDESGVAVRLADGSTERWDLVIGADGVGSAVRRHVLDEELTPDYIGQSAFRVNIPRLPQIDRIILQASPGGVAGVVPIGADLAYLFYNAEMDRDQRPSGDELRPALMERLAPFGALIAEIRDHHIPEGADIVLRPEEAMIAPAPWHRGRVVLMGDAVHAVPPHLGQGAAQAIEDGVVLAECLLAHGDDHAGAFEEYTERRYERCKLIVETCVDIGRWERGLLPGFDNVAATAHALEEMAKPL
jgi:2-polyprenyl-6-methoxyphenol hydroxylase-like FAD-dependent oxidoreductase